MDPPSSSSSERWPGWGDDEKKHSITDTIDIEKGENGEELDARKERIRDCMTVLGGFLSIMATGGAINSVGLLQTHWENNQLREYSPQTVGWIAGTNLFLSLFVPVLAGPVFDRYGHVWILAVGSSLFVVGLFIISFFDDHSPAPVTLGMMISSWGVLCGTGYGLIQTAVPGLICRRFDRRRGLANGFSSLGNSVGGVLWPMLLRVALERLGWSWSMRAIDGLALVMLAIGNVLVWGSGVPVVGTAAKPEPESSDNEKNREEQVEEGKKPSLTWGQCIRNGARCFRKGDFVWMTASLAIFQFVVMGVAGTLPSWGQQQGFKDASLFFYVVAVVNAGAAAGRVVVCSISDSLGRFNSVIIVQTMVVIVGFGIWHNVGTDERLLYVFAALWGFANGAILGLWSPLVGELCDVENFGRYLSAASSVVSIAGLLCVPSSAQILATLGPNIHVIFFGTLLILSLMFMVMARVTFTGYSFKIWRAV